MSITESILLGVLQGLTEFLPVSSSGQLVLAEHFFGLDTSNLQDFDIYLHAGTLLALLFLFARDLKGMALFLWQPQRYAKDGQMLKLLLIGTLPAVIFGLFLNDYLSVVRNPLYVAILLSITALVFIVAERKPAQKTKITWRNALVIGFFQVLAMLPGVSRSGLTISGGLFQGIKREIAARYSFMLAIPIIAGATILSLLKGFSGGLSPQIIAWGFASSALCSFLTAKFLLVIFRKYPLSLFSIFLFVESAVVIWLN